MARILGEAGRYVSQQAGEKQRRMLAAALIAIAVISWITGILVGVSFFKKLWLAWHCWLNQKL